MSSLIICYRELPQPIGSRIARRNVFGWVHVKTLKAMYAMAIKRSVVGTLATLHSQSRLEQLNWRFELPEAST